MAEIYREEALTSRYADLEQTTWPTEPRLRLIGLGLVLGAISILGYLQNVPISRYAYVPGAFIRLSPSSHGPASQREQNTLVIEVDPSLLKDIKSGAEVFVQLSSGGASSRGEIKEIAPESPHIGDSPRSKINVYVELDNLQIVPEWHRNAFHLGQTLLLRVVLRRERLRNVIWAHESAP